jgi:hypothetical protein
MPEVSVEGFALIRRPLIGIYLQGGFGENSCVSSVGASRKAQESPWLERAEVVLQTHGFAVADVGSALPA